MNNDFLKKVRSTMIGNMQTSMRTIRGLMHMSEGHLGSLLGMSASEIVKLEQQQEQMTETQYVALCGYIDYKMGTDERLRESIKRQLHLEEKSLLERWFLFFDEEMEEHPILKHGQELQEDTLQMIAKEYKVFMNYDSLKLCRGNKVFQTFLKALKMAGQPLLIPDCVLAKLQQDMFSYNRQVSSEARSALSVLNRLKENQLIALQDDICEGTVEEKIRQLFCNNKRNVQTILITENKELAKDLQSINEKMDGFDIRVITLQGGGMKLYRNLLIPEEQVVDTQSQTTGWDL